jgi:anti-sigma regulatory factor (Ser/Thr protein kinase)
MDIVRLSVPGTLLYRDVVLRVVGSVCRLLRDGAESGPEPSHVVDFDKMVISAVGEAFNNVVLHAYGESHGEAVVELRVDAGTLTVRMSDRGKGFDLFDELRQERETLRESNMGLEIMLACMDEVTYARGDATTPNVLTMTKRYGAGSVAARPE